MRVSSIFRWHNNRLHALEHCDMTTTTIAVADSWFVDEGRVLALDLHRVRFLEGVERQSAGSDPAENARAFWDAAIAAIPRTGQWFPRVEWQRRPESTGFVFRLRSAPERSNSVVVATHPGPDPRTEPTVKGPDLESMLRLRTEVQKLGAGEAVILSPDGFVVEGAYSALAWWKNDVLCFPSLELDRIDSVTARTIETLATALGETVLHESVTPDDLDELEVWSMSALHGPRIITKWVNGPRLAELPGRLATWRSRLDRLRAPLP